MPPHWAVAGRTAHDVGGRRIDGCGLSGGLIWVNRWSGVEGLAKGGEALSGAVAEKAKVAHFNKAFGQNVLEEAADELLGVEGAGLERAGVGGTVVKGDLAVGQAPDTPVGDGDAKDVGSEVAHGREAVADRLAVDNPIFVPHIRGDIGKEVGSGFAQGVAELGTKDDRESLDGQ